MEIINDSNPYPALLGIDWAFDNLAIINLKKRLMIFEGNDIGVIVPLDLVNAQTRRLDMTRWPS